MCVNLSPIARTWMPGQMVDVAGDMVFWNFSDEEVHGLFRQGDTAELHHGLEECLKHVVEPAMALSWQQRSRKVGAVHVQHGTLLSELMTGERCNEWAGLTKKSSKCNLELLALIWPSGSGGKWVEEDCAHSFPLIPRPALVRSPAQ